MQRQKLRSLSVGTKHAFQPKPDRIDVLPRPLVPQLELLSHVEVDQVCVVVIDTRRAFLDHKLDALEPGNVTFEWHCMVAGS